MHIYQDKKVEWDAESIGKQRSGLAWRLTKRNKTIAVSFSIATERILMIPVKIQY
jgi:hypothetical protein